MPALIVSVLAAYIAARLSLRRFYSEKWWESDDTFAISLDEIGNINTWEIRTTFEGDGVTVEMVEVGTGLGAATFGGTVEE